MAAKEKARELFHEYYSTDAHKNSIEVRTENAKNESILRVNVMLAGLHKEYNDNIGNENKGKWIIARIEFWQQVKQEINSL